MSSSSLEATHLTVEERYQCLPPQEVWQMQATTCGLLVGYHSAHDRVKAQDDQNTKK